VKSFGRSKGKQGREKKDVYEEEKGNRALRSKTYSAGSATKISASNWSITYKIDSC
jgi:hypothetical protein